MLKKNSPIITLSVLALSNVALAQQYGQQYTGITQVGSQTQTVGGLVSLLGQIVRWTYIIFFIVAVLLSIFADDNVAFCTILDG